MNDASTTKEEKKRHVDFRRDEEQGEEKCTGPADRKTVDS